VTRGICTTNNRFKRSRIFDSKTKINFHSRTENTWFTPGIEVWSADRKFWIFFDSHGYEWQLNLIRTMGFGHVPTPAKHVLLVNMNMLQGLKIHQGLKIKKVFRHEYFKCLTVNAEPRWYRWLGDRLTIQKSLVWTSGWDERSFFCKKNDSFRKLHQLSKRTCDYFSKTNKQKLKNFLIPCDLIAGLLDVDHSKLLTGQLSSILFLSTQTNALYLSHVSSGDFTTVEYAIERTLNNSCSPSLARKTNSWKLESMFSKHFISGWI